MCPLHRGKLRSEGPSSACTAHSRGTAFPSTRCIVCRPGCTRCSLGTCRSTAPRRAAESGAAEAAGGRRTSCSALLAFGSGGERPSDAAGSPGCSRPLRCSCGTLLGRGCTAPNRHRSFRSSTRSFCCTAAGGGGRGVASVASPALSPPLLALRLRAQAKPTGLQSFPMSPNPKAHLRHRPLDLHTSQLSAVHWCRPEGGDGCRFGRCVEPFLQAACLLQLQYSRAG